MEFKEKIKKLLERIDKAEYVDNGEILYDSIMSVKRRLDDPNPLFPLQDLASSLTHPSVLDIDGDLLKIANELESWNVFTPRNINTRQLKNFIFIDNDDQNGHMVPSSLEYTKSFINKCGVADFNWDDHQKVFGYWRLDRDAQTDIIIGTPRNQKSDIIVTWSMYTVDQVSNSANQMVNMLKSFGRNYINDRVYLDASGLIKSLIEGYLNDSMKTGQCDVIRAIENNYIITLSDDKKPQRLRINTLRREYSDKWYVCEDIDFNGLLWD